SQFEKAGGSRRIQIEKRAVGVKGAGANAVKRLGWHERVLMPPTSLVKRQTLNAATWADGETQITSGDLRPRRRPAVRRQVGGGGKQIASGDLRPSRRLAVESGNIFV